MVGFYFPGSVERCLPFIRAQLGDSQRKTDNGQHLT